jgi:hypothetical protein
VTSIRVRIRLPPDGTRADIPAADAERQHFKRKRKSTGTSYPAPDPHHCRKTFALRPLYGAYIG